jgi:hypothetical protein
MDITGGVRQMFTNEYWAFDDPPFSMRWPSPNRITWFTLKCDTLFGPQHENCTVNPWEHFEQEKTEEWRRALVLKRLTRTDDCIQ